MTTPAIDSSPENSVRSAFLKAQMDLFQKRKPSNPDSREMAIRYMGLLDKKSAEGVQQELYIAPDQKNMAFIALALNMTVAVTWIDRETKETLYLVNHGDEVMSAFEALDTDLEEYIERNLQAPQVA